MKLQQAWNGQMSEGLRVPWMLVLVVVCIFVPASSVGAKTESDPRLKAPWVASIFMQNPENNLWEYICGGTITSSSTVITSVRCILPRTSRNEKLSERRYHYKYSELRVVAGLRTNNFDAKDQFTQHARVGQIRDHFSFQVNPDTPHKDLAAIRLLDPFNLSTPYVKPVLLTERGQTILEANATRPGNIVTVAGFERPDLSDGIQTRSKSNQTLQIHEVKLTDVNTCLDHYTSTYEAFYFDVYCGKAKTPKSLIPCRFEGAGMISQAQYTSEDPKLNKPELYLLGVYSSNTALAKSEGLLKTKNALKPEPCKNTETIFFARLGYLERWGISNDFCGGDLAMCLNNKCRPFSDLCNGSTQCDDKSDEIEEMCHNNKKQK